MIKKSSVYSVGAWALVAHARALELFGYEPAVASAPAIRSITLTRDATECLSARVAPCLAARSCQIQCFQFIDLWIFKQAVFIRKAHCRISATTTRG